MDQSALFGTGTRLWQAKNMILSTQIAALLQVIAIDVSLAGDNAIVIGTAASGLHVKQRRQALWIGLAVAIVLRILLAIFAVQLLHIVGLMLAGGLLLLWVAWKMFRDIRQQNKRVAAHAVASDAPKKLSAAVWQILFADVAMSLDNVLAVAAAAREHYFILALGLIFSVALMGFAATLTAKWMQRFPWIGWIGFATVLYVAVRMIVDGVGSLSG
jgi:YjbE family integral membrane protein